METLGFVSVLVPVLSTATVYDLVEDQEIRGTTVTGLATSLTSVVAIESAQAKNVDITNQYIESLSDDDLYRMEKLLSEKEDSFAIEDNNENIKTL